VECGEDLKLMPSWVLRHSRVLIRWLSSGVEVASAELSGGISRELGCNAGG
jgi:hypothetical protein